MSSSSDRDGGRDQPLEAVPIDLDPCELREWMKTHSSWILSLDDALSPDEIRLLYLRHVESPCPDEGVLSEIAAHPNTPSDVLVELAESKWRGTHLALALNTRLPDRVIRRLARTRRMDVLEHIASNPSTPTDVLKRLARHPKAVVAREIARQSLATRDKE